LLPRRRGREARPRRAAWAGVSARVPGVRRQRQQRVLPPRRAAARGGVSRNIRRLLRGRGPLVPAAPGGLPGVLRAGSASAAPGVGVVWPAATPAAGAAVTQRGTRLLAEPAGRRTDASRAVAPRRAGGQ